jgi:hypothetical protein
MLVISLCRPGLIAASDEFGSVGDESLENDAGLDVIDMIREKVNADLAIEPNARSRELSIELPWTTNLQWTGGSERALAAVWDNFVALATLEFGAMGYDLKAASWKGAYQEKHRCGAGYTWDEIPTTITLSLERAAKPTRNAASGSMPAAQALAGTLRSWRQAATGD